MKTIKTMLATMAFLTASHGPATAQPFQSGSNGSYGPLNVTTGDVTLGVAPDGLFHCTTLYVTRTVRFRPNALNTPVYLLATGDVTITGIIDLSGGRGSASTPGFSGP